MFKRKSIIALTAITFSLLASYSWAQSSVSSSERWFQIELSIFSNESALDRSEEKWQSDRSYLAYPQRIERLKTLMDLLMIDQLRPQIIDTESDLVVEQITASTSALNSNFDTELDTVEIETPALSLYPEARVQQSLFKFYDTDREALIQLPASLSDFQQTNRAIERSADHRLLFHGLWRQPVTAENLAKSIYVSGGQKFADQHELQGSVTIRFNDNADRVVIDADLWLSEFSSNLNTNDLWKLPAIPDQFVDSHADQDLSSQDQLEFSPSRIFHMQQSRDMRSTEFHYLDHPAMGIVILVTPYEIPPFPISEEERPELDSPDLNN